ncbi:Mce family protein [Antrihabitans stalactiti]|uniref:Mce family protein n=1 Tax=Antrihabitans stalactiti TaxID=2584121 RepID=A0A848KJ42_9NOCA|nr:Mce family protein [Antrihabitans stalactiti]NMN96692.1 Mce family protein [Antrihabitans stalactiti]
MSKARNQDFLRGTDAQQARIVNITAAAFVAVLAVVAIAVFWVYPHVKPEEGLHLSVDVPSVAPGVRVGSKVILHGAEIGEVTSLEKAASGVRLALALEPGDVQGLTDTFDVDFRPANYFGITAVNVVSKPGGSALSRGEVLNKLPTGDFTMSTMLEKGSLVVSGTLTDSMISTLDKMIRYANGLTPMIQTGIVVGDRVAATQQAVPSQLMADLNATLDVMPAFSSQALDTLYNLFVGTTNRLPDGSLGVDDAFMTETNQAMVLASGDLFGAAGTLLASHGAELTPVTGIVQAMTDVVPGLLGGTDGISTLTALVDRYQRAFTVTPDGATANLRIIVDEMPGGHRPPGEEMPR